MPQTTGEWDIPEGEFAIWGEARMKPEHADKVEQVYRELTRLTLADPTCLQYCIARDPTDRALFHFYERYRSKKDWEDHCNWPIVKRFLSSGWTEGFTAVFAKPILPYDGPEGFKEAKTGIEDK